MFIHYVAHDENLTFSQYRTIVSQANHEPVFATPLELDRLLQYADKLKSSAHAHLENNTRSNGEEGGPGRGGARQAWAQGPTSKFHKHSRGGAGGHKGGGTGADRSRRGAGGAGGQRVVGGGGSRSFRAAEDNDSNDTSDDTSSSCYSFATPGDWATEAASLAAAFGGVFTSMHEDAQKLKRKEADNMVRQWQQGVSEYELARTLHYI